MAAYTKTTTLQASIDREVELINNTIVAKIMHDFNVLMNVEFQKMEDDGLAGYTVTSGLQQTMTDLVINMPDLTSRLIYQKAIDMFIESAEEVETEGLAFTSSYTMADFNKVWENWPNVIDRICLANVNALVGAEMYLITLAS